MSNIYEITKDKCTGCGACASRCPFGAITMALDNEGFLSPIIDNDKCVECGKCYDTCPEKGEAKLNSAPKSYAVWASDDIRAKSSSGGMFTLIAREILKDGGAVCGARYSENAKSVYHAWAENEEQIEPLRGPKYIQSDIGNTYKEAKAYLDLGKSVLFTGTPCQIAGLYSFLGADYPKLYTADVVCQGQNSILAYRAFLDEFSEGKEYTGFSFRDKGSFGWVDSATMYFADGSVKKAPWNECKWYDASLKGVISRRACSSCQYSSMSRIADLTLADCRQARQISPALDDRKGTSLVLVNTKKGEKLFKAVSGNMTLCERVPLDTLAKHNPRLLTPPPIKAERDFFFTHLDKGFNEAYHYGMGLRYDVGIVGWWFASNYGSSLTYFALASILEKMGKLPIFIRIPKLDNTPWDKDAEQTIEFIGKRFKISSYRDIGHLNEVNKFCDSFLVGSDQMWTPLATKLVGYTFFLDFVDLNKKKIAFSTSFGQDTFLAEEKICNTASDFLKRFDAISVREYTGISICKDKLGVQAEQIIDPVFMCTPEKYDELAGDAEVDVPEKYLLSYILDPTPEKERAVAEIAVREGLEVLSIMSMRDYDKNAAKFNVGKIVPKPSTEQFLKYIKNCSYLVTDSHHGACMGIIYGRNYVAITNASRGVTRFETVAKAFGLESRVLYNPLDAVGNDKIHQPIDYTRVRKAIDKESQNAWCWLERAFAKPTKEAAETVNTLEAKRYALERCLENTIRWYEWRLKTEK